MEQNQTEPDVQMLRSAIHKRWPETPDVKVGQYVDAFFDKTRRGSTIAAKVVGNHGTYTVSIRASEGGTSAACSCYIGKGGWCHHCQALGKAFLNRPEQFREIRPTPVKSIQGLEGVQSFLQGVTLEDLLGRLKEHGITQKAFAESIGMSTRHLTAIKSSELRNHYFHELGATKLACLWVLSNVAGKR